MSEKKTLLEIYSPKSLKDLYLPNRIETLLTNTTTDARGWRLFQHGPPGTGKTSTAKLLTLGHDVLYLSGSNDFNVEVMRQKVYPFVSGHSVLGRQKSLIVDECENVANKIQDGFKVVLDTAKSVNFVFNTNEPETVNSAIKSRCVNVEYSYQGQEITEQQKKYISYAVRICNENNIRYDNRGLKLIYQMNFPDFRHLLVILQQFIDSKRDVTEDNVVILSENGTANVELYELIQSNAEAQKFYEAVSAYKGKERECLISLGEPYFTWLNSQGKYEHTMKAAAIVCDYSFRYVTTINKFGTFFACISALRSIFR
jgi:replication-associated recombination protein RarA